MKQVGEGIYDLQNEMEYDLSWDEVQIILEVYGEGIERYIALAILTCCNKYKRWVGVSMSKILMFLVNCQGEMQGVKPDEEAKINQLTIKLGREMMAVIAKGLEMETPWIREVGHSSPGKRDTVLALNVRHVTVPPFPEPSEN